MSISGNIQVQTKKAGADNQNRLRYALLCSQQATSIQGARVPHACVNRHAAATWTRRDISGSLFFHDWFGFLLSLTIVKIIDFFVDLKNLFLSYFIFISGEKKGVLLTGIIFPRTLTIVNCSFDFIAGHQERLRE
jgi:hypothetical protein